MLVLSAARLHEENIKSINVEYTKSKKHWRPIHHMYVVQNATCQLIVMVAAWYIPWNQLADVTQSCTDGLDGQIERITGVKAQVMKAKETSKRIIILEDIDIDMSEDVV